MTNLRRLIVAFSLLAGLVPAFAQAPPPVPALPDTERRTTYTISASYCSCSVGFALYGDSTDYGNWIEVFVNGTLLPATNNWIISSPTGSLATIPRPITDAVLTFVSPQTGTVQIVGARRPRRTSQFNESRGVAARDINQALSDLTAQNREVWDKINDVTGRSVRTPPGESLALLPPLSGRASMGACFDSNGNLTSCVSAAGSGFAAGSGIVFTGTNPTTISAPTPSITYTAPGTGAVSRTLNAKLFADWVDAHDFGAVCDGVTDDTAAIQNAINATPQGGTLWIPQSAFNQGCLIKTGGVSNGNSYSLIVNKPINIRGGGRYSWLKTDGSIGTTTTALYAPVSFVDWRGTTFEGFSIGNQPGGSPFTRNGGRGLWFDAVSTGASGFYGLTVRNLNIGESGNDYSFRIDGISTQENYFEKNYICGGFDLHGTADSNHILRNFFCGTSTFGIRIDATSNGTSAGATEFIGNSMGIAAGLIIEGGTGIDIANNYFEETAATQYAHNAFIDLNGATSRINNTNIHNNLIFNFFGTTTLGIRVNNADATFIGNGNYFYNNGTPRSPVFAVTGAGTIYCTVNQWATGTPHISGTVTVKNAIGSTVTDCP